LSVGLSCCAFQQFRHDPTEEPVIGSLDARNAGQYTHVFLPVPDDADVVFRAAEPTILDKEASVHHARNSTAEPVTPLRTVSEPIKMAERKPALRRDICL
jgi:hypothetical protein